MTVKYLYQFQNLSERLDGKAVQKQRKANIQSLRNDLTSTTNQLRKAFTCAQLIFHLDPDNEEIADAFLELQGKAQELDSTFRSYFGKDLESLSNIENVDVFKSKLEEIASSSADLEGKIRDYGTKLNGDYEEIIKKYKSAKSSGLDVSSINERVFADVKVCKDDFKNIASLSQKIKARGIDKLVEGYKQLHLQLAEEVSKLNDILVNAQDLSPDAEAFLETLNTGRRLLLKDIDPSIIKEIQDKRPELGTRYAIRLL